MSNSSDGSRPVGTKTANLAELHDMSGNVQEWCWDWYSSSTDTDTVTDPAGPGTGTWRMLPGGDFYNSESNCRVFTWSAISPDTRGSGSYYFGFRVVCSAVTP
jgi:formylglycine-generating enzyme required for sulfatase activity